MAFKRILPIIPLIASFVLLLKPEIIANMNASYFMYESIVLLIYSIVSVIGMTKDYYLKPKISNIYIISICLCQLLLTISPIIRLLRNHYFPIEDIILVISYSMMLGSFLVCCANKLYLNHIPKVMFIISMVVMVVCFIADFSIDSNIFSHYSSILIIDFCIIFNTFIDFYPEDFLIRVNADE